MCLLKIFCVLEDRIFFEYSYFLFTNVSPILSAIITWYLLITILKMSRVKHLWIQDTGSRKTRGLPKHRRLLVRAKRKKATKTFCFRENFLEDDEMIWKDDSYSFSVIYVHVGCEVKALRLCFEVFQFRH